jgi:hypothetical protein
MTDLHDANSVCLMTTDGRAGCSVPIDWLDVGKTYRLSVTMTRTLDSVAFCNVVLVPIDADDRKTKLLTRGR